MIESETTTIQVSKETKNRLKAYAKDYMNAPDKTYDDLINSFLDSMTAPLHIVTIEDLAESILVIERQRQREIRGKEE